MVKPLFSLGLLLAAAIALVTAGVSEANGGHVHVGELSGAASLVIVVAGGVLVALFIGLFVVRWRQAGEDSGDEYDDDAVPDEGPEYLEEE